MQISLDIDFLVSRVYSNQGQTCHKVTMSSAEVVNIYVSHRKWYE